MTWLTCAVLASQFFSCGLAYAAEAFSEAPVRIKDLVEVRGVRPNQLTGLGLVIGLQGTGDSKASIATNKAASMAISRLGITVAPNEVLTKNAAVVVVTADLQPFARVGDRVDIRLSSVGDASSLEGGTLLFTTLSAADDQIYATAQGPISQGSAMSGAQGGGGGQGSANTAPKTVAITNGGMVEKEFEATFIHDNAIELSLRNADFTTANRICSALNNQFGQFIATPINAGLVHVALPTTVDRQHPAFNAVSFMAQLEQILVIPDTQAVIVINERTGTIVSGGHVVIAPVAISHGDLDIQIAGSSDKKTGKVAAMPATTTVGDLVKTLNQLGAGPKDVVSIIQSLSAAKALKAQVKIL